MGFNPTLTTLTTNGSNRDVISFSNIPVGVYIFIGNVYASATTATTFNFVVLNLLQGTTSLQLNSLVTVPTAFPAGYTQYGQVSAVIVQYTANTLIHCYANFTTASQTSYNVAGNSAQLIRIA